MKQAPQARASGACCLQSGLSLSGLSLWTQPLDRGKLLGLVAALQLGLHGLLHVKDGGLDHDQQ